MRFVALKKANKVKVVHNITHSNVPHSAETESLHPTLSGVAAMNALSLYPEHLARWRHPVLPSNSVFFI